MKALVLSDIHGNGEALRSVLEESHQQEWQEIWFLGDLCGYGPDSTDCFRMLMQHKIVFLCGNHDLYMTGEMEKEYFSDMARIALIIGRANLGPELLNFLSHQSARQTHRGVDMVHASPRDPAGAYILNEHDARVNMPHAHRKTLFFGHSHVQEYYVRDKDGSVIRDIPDGNPLSCRRRQVMINPGSVGQPRDGDNRAAWGLYDTKSREFSFFRTAYDYGITQQRMRERGYPDYLVERLSSGV